jgi:hypothetical protein
MKKFITTVSDRIIKHQKELIFWGTSAVVMLAVICTALFLSSQVLPTYEEDSFHSSAPSIEAGEIESVASAPVHFPATYSEKTNDALGTVKEYFKSYNDGDFKNACRLLSSAKCNPESPYAVDRLAEESGKMVNGYENWNFWMAEGTEDFHSDVVCVKYSYHYKGDTKVKRVHERMSFYVRRDENGNDRIYSRVCEKKFAQDSGDMPCPVLSRKDFCLN